MNISVAIKTLQGIAEEQGPDSEIALSWWTWEDIESRMEDYHEGETLTTEEKNFVLRRLENDMDADDSVVSDLLREAIGTVFLERTGVNDDN